MNDWHKRLILFFCKVIGVIILLIIIALFLYYNYFFKKDNLIKYIPQEAVIYTTFKLNNEINENQLVSNLMEQVKIDYNLPEIDYKILNQFIGYNSAFALLPNFVLTDPVGKNDDISLDYLFVFDIKEHKQEELDSYMKFLDNHTWQGQVLKINALEKNILIVSNSQQVLEKVKKIVFQQESSLGDNINVVINLNKIKLGNIGKIYINFEGLVEKLDKITDPRFKLAIASFETENISELYFGVKSENNQLLLKPIEANFDNTTTKLLLDRIPANFAINTNFINGEDKILNIMNLLEETDPLYWQKISKNLDYYQGILNFNLEKDILSLFKQKSQIVIDKDNNYIISLEIGNEANFTEKIDKLEEILVELLAINNAQETPKQLVDYSYITQFTKDRETITRNSEEIANISLISLESNGLEFSYYINENQLILGNSRQILYNLISDKDLLELYYHECYKDANFSQNIAIKGDYISNIWSGFKKIKIIVLSQDNKSNIWLCLD
jgi:hypothetical protein